GGRGKSESMSEQSKNTRQKSTSTRTAADKARQTADKATAPAAETAKGAATQAGDATSAVASGGERVAAAANGAVQSAAKGVEAGRRAVVATTGQVAAGAKTAWTVVAHRKLVAAGVGAGLTVLSAASYAVGRRAERHSHGPLTRMTGGRICPGRRTGPGHGGHAGPVPGPRPAARRRRWPPALLARQGPEKGRCVRKRRMRPSRRSGHMQHERAGGPAGPEDLVDVARLVTAYYALRPDPDDPAQRVAFGTSGHRGSSLKGAFNDDHIAATSQAICEYRAAQGTDGPLYLGADTHALSEPARVTALEVFAANGVTVLIDSADGYTPTPAVPHAILTHNPPTADSSTTRPAAAPPAPTPRPGSRTAPTTSSGAASRTSAASRTRAPSPPTAPAATTSSAATWPTCPRCWTWTRSARPESGSGPTRSAARRWPTGAGSPRSTAST